MRFTAVSASSSTSSSSSSSSLFKAAAVLKQLRRHHSGSSSALHRRTGYTENTVNPYCTFCKSIFSGLLKKADASPEALCLYQPENQKATCATVAASMKKNRDVKQLLKGCVDKTGPAGGLWDKWRKPVENKRWPTTDAEWAESENFVESEAGVKKGANECPPLCACNAIESYTGAPMCGVKLRGWGDFAADYWRPLPPNTQDTFPSDEQSIQTFHSFESTNPDCEMCIDLFNQLNLQAAGGASFLELGDQLGISERLRAGAGDGAGTGSAEDLCKQIPEGLKEQCQGIANKGAGRGSSPGADYPGFAQRRDVYKLLKGGCVDLSTITPIEQLPGKCPGLIACNIIRDLRGGPMCGMRLRQWGDFAIPDGSEAVAGEPPLMPCPTQTSGTGNSLPCPSTMRHG